MIAADDQISIQQLAIQQLMARFATGIDSCDWSMYRAVFTDEIDLDYSSWRPGSIGRWAADDWVARGAAMFPGLTATRHALSNMLIERDVDALAVRVNVAADHVLIADGITAVFTFNGYYEDRCVPTADGWKIATKRLVTQWCVGDPSVLDRARDRVAAGADDLRSAVPRAQSR